MSDFYQWFYFRLAGAAGREVTLRITNCAGSAYPHGWPDYKGVMSLDREEWVRITDTSYANGVLTMKLTPPQDLVWIAYFAPYSMERHHDLVTQTAALPGVEGARNRDGHAGRTRMWKVAAADSAVVQITQTGGLCLLWWEADVVLHAPLMTV
jgi:murein tripeptide amidase MpaA